MGVYPGRIHVDTRTVADTKTCPYYYRKPSASYVSVPGGFPGWAPSKQPAAVAATPATPANNAAVPIKFSTKTVDGVSINGVTYAPVRALAEAMGHTIEWDGKQVTVR